MEINNISAVSNPISFVHGSSSTDLPRASTKDPFRKGISGGEKEWNINHSHFDFVKLQKVNDRLNSAAKGQRTFEKMNNYIEQMKAQLETILKQFPPFPPGSDERIQALRAYVSIRKMIDQLTIPPREEFLPPPTEEIENVPDSVNSKRTELNSQSPLSYQNLETQISS
jgi:hypothetical protein